MKKSASLKNLFILLLFSATLPVHAQNIYTIAGTSSPGDYNVATNASIATPQGIAVDSSGNTYVSEANYNRVRKIQANTGIISTVAGSGTIGYSGDGGPATSARLNNPSAIAVDKSGNIFIADCNNNRIRKVQADTRIITTIAGTATIGYSGDGGPATSANLNNPYGIAVDNSGNVYFSDKGNRRIRKITVSTGIITTVAGTGSFGSTGDGGPATNALFYTPSGIDVDNNGNMYIADPDNKKIRKITASTGIITTVAGTGNFGYSGDGGAATSAQLMSPYYVTVDDNNNVYIADYDSYRIRKITAATGIISTAAGTGTAGYSGDGSTATSAQLFNPYGVAADAGGNVYVCDYNNSRVRKITAATGVITTFAGSGNYSFSGDGGQATSAQLSDPFRVAIDNNGNVYISDRGNNRIRKVTSSTGIITTIAGTSAGSGFSGDGGPASSAQINDARGVAVDGSGNVYIADYNNHRIRKITAGTGIITTIAGTGTAGYAGDGGPASSARLNYPMGVSVDGSGNIYIADLSNARIRKITAGTGIISTVAGTGAFGYSGDGGAATAAQLSSPTDITVDAAGNLYIADYSNFRFRKVTKSSGIITTIAGNGSAGYSGDGGPATSAQVYNANSVAVDANGNVFIGDNNYPRVRKVNAATGIISTITGNGTYGFTGDGGPAASAQVGGTYGVAVDAGGNVYVADAGNNRIRYICAGSSLPSGFTALQQTAYSGLNNTLFFNSTCATVMQMTPSGANPVAGSVADSVWVEPSVPVNRSGNVYLQRHYGITPSINASTATATVMLYYTQAEFTAFNAMPNHGANLPVNATDAANYKANLVINKRSGTSSNGTGLFDSYQGPVSTITPTSVTWNSSLNRWEVAFDVAGFSGFFASSAAMAALPLTLVDFNGRTTGNGNEISWKTGSETNTAFFDLERSADGKNFGSISRVNAAGTSVTTQRYLYVDTHAVARTLPVVYYRLKMVDRDGAFTQSKIIGLESKENGGQTGLFPNPVRSVAAVQVSLGHAEKLQIAVLDQSGHLVKTDQVNVQAGPSNVAIDLSLLPAGIYTVSISGPHTRTNYKVVKQ